MAARFAHKLRLASAIALIAMATFTASSARISWINHNKLYPCKGGFICNKGPELPERPAGHARSLMLAKTFPLGYASQVFYGNSAASFLGNINNASRDLMILRSSVIGLPFSDSIQVALCRPSAAGLQDIPKSLRSCSICFKILSCVHDSGRINCNLRHTEIDADDICRNVLGSVAQLDRQVEIKASFGVNQVCLTSFKRRLQSSALIVCDHDWNQS